MSFNRWGSVVDGVDDFGNQDTTDTRISDIRSDGVSIYTAIPDGAIVRNLMDEGSGTTAADSIGTNDLTLNSPTWVSGVGNGGFHLDFSGGDVATWDSVPFTGSADRTFACWINPDSFSGEAIMDVGSNASQSRWTFRGLSGNLRIEIENGGYTTSLSPSSGSWVPVGLALGGSTINDHLFYLDGSTESATGDSTEVQTGSNVAQLAEAIGGSAGNFDGQIDDPIWSDTAWTADDFDQWVSATQDNYS